MKKRNKILIGILVIFIIVGGVVAYNFTFTSGSFPKPSPAPEPIINNFVFDCDGKQQMAEGYEPDGKWDANDVEFVVRNNCNEAVTNIYKDNELWQCYEGNYKLTCSFDVNVLKEAECKDNGFDYDKGDCVERN